MSKTFHDDYESGPVDLSQHEMAQWQTDSPARAAHNQSSGLGWFALAGFVGGCLIAAYGWLTS